MSLRSIDPIVLAILGVAILGFLLLPSADGQSVGLIWSDSADSFAVVTAQTVSATGAAVDADATPTVDIWKVRGSGTISQIVTNANMSQFGSELGSYYYVFPDTIPADSVGMVLTTRVEATVSGITTAKLETSRHSNVLRDLLDLRSSFTTAQADLDNPSQYQANVSNLDVAVSTRQPSGTVTLTTAERSAITDSLQAEASDFQADISSLATAAALAAAQADLDNPTQYQASSSANVDTLKWFLGGGPSTKYYTYPTTANRPDSVYITSESGDTIAVELPTFDSRGRVTTVQRKNK